MKWKMKTITISVVCVLVFIVIVVCAFANMTEKYVYVTNNGVITATFRGEEFISYKMEAEISCTGPSDVETTYKLYSPSLWMDDYEGISILLEKGDNRVTYQMEIIFSELTKEGRATLKEGFASKSDFLKNTSHPGTISRYLVILGIPINIENLEIEN